MYHKQSLDGFIIYWARIIAAIYPNSYADEEDYIQIGHLKLAEICKNKQEKRDFQTYAIAAIVHAIRNAAIETAFLMSAPLKTKILAIEVNRRIAIGQSETIIRQQLKITTRMWQAIRQLIKPKVSLHTLYGLSYVNSETSMILSDLLEMTQLTSKDKALIRAQYNDDVTMLGLSRKQLWTRIRQIREKLNWSDYGTTTD